MEYLQLKTVCDGFNRTMERKSSGISQRSAPAACCIAAARLSPCNAQLLTSVDPYRETGSALLSASAVARAGMLAVSITMAAVTVTLPLVRSVMYTYVQERCSGWQSVRMCLMCSHELCGLTL